MINIKATRKPELDATEMDVNIDTKGVDNLILEGLAIIDTVHKVMKDDLHRSEMFIFLANLVKMVETWGEDNEREAKICGERTKKSSDSPSCS